MAWDYKRRRRPLRDKFDESPFRALGEGWRWEGGYNHDKPCPQPPNTDIFVLADISGYTSFVAKTELEHSHEILTELLELLVENIKPLMTISKLEGDAVFAYAGRNVFARGDTLLEFVESIYVAFRDRQLSMRRKTTCTCNACVNIPTLDLKFIVHCGDYIVQNIANTRELVGSDVNLIHRLSKNHVSEATGWRAYMMLTEQCLNDLGFDSRRYARPNGRVRASRGNQDSTTSICTNATRKSQRHAASCSKKRMPI